jgi:iron complex transport system permease protein
MSCFTTKSWTKKRRFILVALLLLLLVAAFLLNLFLGSVLIPIGDTIKILFGQSPNEVWRIIIIEYRLPKALVAILAGAALSVSGLQMQTIFRNPLAGPYVLGISAGAGLGVAIVVLGLSFTQLQLQSELVSSFTISAAAWLGALFVLLIILAVASRVKDIMTILILGMMFGAAASALISILQYFSNETMLKSYVIWTMGSLSSVSGVQLWILACATLVGLAISVIQIRVLNTLLLGETYARSLGVSIPLSRALVFVSTSLLTGSVTAFCGPIGFIGIAVPHVARMVVKTTNHAILIPVTIMLGSLVMLFSDTMSQLPGMNTTIPINSVTALIGVPIVVYVVFRKKRFSEV